MHINAIRFTKYVDTDEIGIEFIWIDENNPPEDSIGWVAKNKITNIEKIKTNRRLNKNISRKVAAPSEDSDYSY